MESALARGNFGAGSWTLDGLTKTEVQVYSPFESIPNRGFLPVKVKIRNGFDGEREWNFSFQARPQYSYGDTVRSTSTFSIRTPKLSETEHELMVPLPSSLDSSPNTEITMQMTSRLGSRSGSLQGHHHPNFPSIAFSNALDGRDNLEQLSDELRTKIGALSRHEPAAALFEPAELSTDWRGFTGFDVIMLTDKEWMALAPGVRRGILSWNRLGGHLHLFTKSANATTATFGIDDVLPTDQAKRSLGSVLISTWDEDRIPISKTAKSLKDDSPMLSNQLLEDFVTKWGLQNLFGFRSFNPIAVFVILIAFAIAVGPVNLFILAKPGMRHRLFVTTPIISLAASLLLILLIIFQDGFGGTGIRVAVMLLRSEPDERRAYIVQEQISRTGVLLNRSFDLDEPTFISPAVMRSSRWTHFDTSHGLGATFRYAGDTLGGDWFQSRSEQAHFAQTIRPTRARIERLEADADGSPRLFSSIDFDLKELFYVDSEGKVWKSKSSIKTGQEIELEPSDSTALKAFWNQSRENFSVPLKRSLQQLANKEVDSYFAIADDPRDHLIPTLKSIRWARGEKGDSLLVVGSPVDHEPTNGEDNE